MGSDEPPFYLAENTANATLLKMDATSTLSIRLSDGDVFVHLDKAAFSPALREAIKAELPEAIVAPITDDRVSFFRAKATVTTLFATPYNSTCPLFVETTAPNERCSNELSGAMRGIIKAMRSLFPPSIGIGRPA